MAQGKIVQCIGAVVTSSSRGDGMPRVYDALKLEGSPLTLEVQQQLGDGVVRTIALARRRKLRRGLVVTNTGAAISVPVGKETLGRIMDVLATRSTSAAWSTRRCRCRSTARRRSTTNCRRRRSCSRPGSRSSTRSARSPRGGKVGLFGGAGVGKTVNMMDLINNIAKAHRVVGVRRRRRGTREGNDFYHEMMEPGSSSARTPQSAVAMVYGQMNEPPATACASR